MNDPYEGDVLPRAPTLRSLAVETVAIAIYLGAFVTAGMAFNAKAVKNPAAPIVHAQSSAAPVHAAPVKDQPMAKPFKF